MNSQFPSFQVMKFLIWGRIVALTITKRYECIAPRNSRVPVKYNIWPLHVSKLRKIHFEFFISDGPGQIPHKQFLDATNHVTLRHFHSSPISNKCNVGLLPPTTPVPNVSTIVFSPNRSVLMIEHLRPHFRSKFSKHQSADRSWYEKINLQLGFRSSKKATVTKMSSKTVGS